MHSPLFATTQHRGALLDEGCFTECALIQPPPSQADLTFSAPTLANRVSLVVMYLTNASVN